MTYAHETIWCFVQHCGEAPILEAGVSGPILRNSFRATFGSISATIVPYSYYFRQFNQAILFSLYSTILRSSSLILPFSFERSIMYPSESLTM